MSALRELMRQELSDGGIAVPYGRNVHMEVVETATGRVWMSVNPVTAKDYEQFLGTLDDSLRGVGVGMASMDAALFQYSPGSDSEPVRERDIDGRRFINVAIPGEPKLLPGGMMQIIVNKAHVLGYEEGRELVIMSTAEGDFVEVVGETRQDKDLPLPEGASLRTVVLQAPWVVALPTPTVAYFHFAGGIRSFQGPVVVPDAACCIS